MVRTVAARSQQQTEKAHVLDSRSPFIQTTGQQQSARERRAG